MPHSLKMVRMKGTEARIVLDALKANNGYCPCSIIKNEDTKCPCKEFRKQADPGECRCGLYTKTEE